MTAGGTLILLYHRVIDLACDPHGLAVHPDRFARQCDVLRRRCEVVSLRAVDASRRQVAITFDDGYADNAGDARRILAEAGLPATFFITAGPLGERAEAWWDRLAQILLESDITADMLEVEIGGRRLRADLRSGAARSRAHLALFWRLRRLRPAAIEHILDDLALQLGARHGHRETHRWMTIEEMRDLSASSGVVIGAHTLTHPLLAAVDAGEQWNEIAGSREALERLLSTPVVLFSYPHGSADAFDAVTTGLVRKAGYTMACTATGGIARPGTDPLQLPRNVVGNWDADRFEGWLEQWLSQH